ncbi:MAG: hypothetical protein L3K09_01400 [Thermoplasmata archaeon]|nr:hypothetical protein [Thermoplasmata archaeon]
MALIDTGTGRTVLQRGIARSLGLTPVGAVEIDTPSTADVESLEFEVCLEFPGGAMIPTRVLEAEMPVKGIRVLLGREVLSRGVLIYDGRAGRFSLDLSLGENTTEESVGPGGRSTPG